MQTRHSPSLTTLHRYERNIFVFKQVQFIVLYNYIQSLCIVNLFSLARSASILGYEKLPKSILFRKLQESFDIERLQRVEARQKKIQEMSLNKKRSMLEQEKDSLLQIDFKKRKQLTQSSASTSKISLNKLDPIMLCPISKKCSWKFVRPNGRIPTSICRFIYFLFYH